MNITNRECVGRGLDLLAEGLTPFIEQKLKDAFGGVWEEKVREQLRLGPTRADRGWNGDPQKLLSVMWNLWNEAFREHLDPPARNLVRELQDVRNRWAHRDTFDLEDTYRALDSMERLLKAVSAPEAGELGRHKREVLRLISDPGPGKREDPPNAPPVLIAEPSLLIRINRQYRDGMSAAALYDSTRGVWKLGPRRERARYAMAVYQGVVREVYAIEHWLPAGTGPYEIANIEDMRVPGRWEFVGSVAPDGVREKYLGKSVADYFKKGMRSPVLYVNC